MILNPPLGKYHLGNGHSEVYDRYVRRRGTYQTSRCSVMGAYQVEFEPGGGGSKPPNDNPIIVAQRKRVGLITRRTVDRNNPMIY